MEDALEAAGQRCRRNVCVTTGRHSEAKKPKNGNA